VTQGDRSIVQSTEREPTERSGFRGVLGDLTCRSGARSTWCRWRRRGSASALVDGAVLELHIGFVSRGAEVLAFWVLDLEGYIKKKTDPRTWKGWGFGKLSVFFGDASPGSVDSRYKFLRRVFFFTDDFLYPPTPSTPLRVRKSWCCL
jgi:hypothetical protein